jgi:hypothetical protein
VRFRPWSHYTTRKDAGLVPRLQIGRTGDGAIKTGRCRNGCAQGRDIAEKVPIASSCVLTGVQGSSTLLRREVIIVAAGVTLIQPQPLIRHQTNNWRALASMILSISGDEPAFLQ